MCGTNKDCLGLLSYFILNPTNVYALPMCIAINTFSRKHTLVKRSLVQEVRIKKFDRNKKNKKTSLPSLII